MLFNWGGAASRCGRALGLNNFGAAIAIFLDAGALIGADEAGRGGHSRLGREARLERRRPQASRPGVVRRLVVPMP
jgi:hypothetical protein